MTAISYINELYGQEELKRLQRRDARFVNSAFTVTLLGAAVADQLEDGRVLSGVGGQYNFVAQGHALHDARSVIMLRSWRESGGDVSSNIVWEYGHCTIPRHLRDIVVTEYGIADLRGKTDSKVIEALLNITDSRFQTELTTQAQLMGKLPKDFALIHVLPTTARSVCRRSPIGTRICSRNTRWAVISARRSKTCCER